MENKYFVVKPIINGFETVMIVYGVEEDVKKYIEYILRVPCSYNIINDNFAKNLFDIGFKVYMCPSVDTIETEVKEEETESEE